MATGFLATINMAPTLAFLPNIGPLEIGVILVLGLLLFGRKLPEVGRNVGRSIIEFKRGLRDVSSELEAESRRAESESAAKPKPPASLDAPRTGEETGRTVAQQSVSPESERVAESKPESSN